MTDMPTPLASPAIRRKQSEWRLLILALLLVGAFIAYAHFAEASRVDATERNRLQVQTNVVANDIGRNLAATSLALEGVIKDHMTGPGATSSARDVSRRLHALTDAIPGIRAMVLLDEKGVTIAASRPELVGQNFSHRDYFKAVKSQPNLTTLYVSAPFKSVQNDVVIAVARMVPASDASDSNAFGGLVLATIDPEYFTSILRPIVYAPDVWAFVVHGDGQQLLNFPPKGRIDGTDLNRPGTFFKRHQITGQTDSVLTGEVYTTKEQRLMALHTIQPAALSMDKAIVIGLSRELAAIAQPVQRQATIYGLFYTALICLFCGTLYWTQTRRIRLETMTAGREQERVEAAERQKLALRGANLGLWTFHVPSTARTFDESSFSMLGFEPQNTQDDPEFWRRRIHPEDMPAYNAAREACINGSIPFYDVTYRIQHRLGHWVWIMGRAQAIERDARGRAVMIMGTHMDITVAKTAELEVMRTRNELQTVFDNMTEAVLVFNSRCEIVRVNRSGRTLHGLFDPSVPIAQMFSDITLWLPTGELVPTGQWPSRRGLRGDFLRDFEMEIRRKGGDGDRSHNDSNNDNHSGSGKSVFVEYNTAPVRDEMGRIELLIVTFRDITDRRLSHALREARDIAEASNRSKAEFLANMSHEIRSPLNAILGLAYLLEQAHLDHDAQDMVQKIRTSGSSLLGIINDVLDVSKIEAGHMVIEHAPFRLGDVIDNLAGIMGIAAGSKNLELVILPLPTGIFAVKGDALRLEQVLVNLTSNAIKFTQAGQVTLRTELLNQHDDRLMLRFCVQDTGIGIAPELQVSVFSAFTQADSSTTRRFGGTGLGLAICRQLVTLMGGEIGLTSMPGQGSEFWFTLPLLQVASADFSSPDMVHIDALIADDSDIALEAVAAIARGLGWQVSAVDSGEAVLSQVQSRKDENGKLPNVVVLDWQMPGMDGLATARAIREGVPEAECPIVIMATAYSLSSLASQPGAEMVDAILNKPVTTSTLYNAVIEAQRRRAATVGIPQALRQTQGRGLADVRVLVVDDSDINREVAQRILHEQGATVTLAVDGQAALDWLQAHPQDVDLVLMDVQMPVMDGIEATRQLRLLPQFNNLPIVALTAGAFKSQQDAAHAAGMTDFISKPFDVPSTIALIQRLRRRASSASPEPVSPITDNMADGMAHPMHADTGLHPGTVALDVAQGLQIWSDVQTYRDYLHRFVESHSNAVAVMNASLANDDHAAAAALAHKLTGVAANMALPAVQRLAAEAERVLAVGYDATPVLQRLDDALKQAALAIAQFAPHAPPRATSAFASASTSGQAGQASTTEPAAPATTAELQTLFTALLAALDTDNPAPAEPILAKLGSRLPSQNVLAELASIQACLRSFDFRGAEASTRALARLHGITPRE